MFNCSERCLSGTPIRSNRFPEKVRVLFGDERSMNIEGEIMKNVSFVTVLAVIGWTLVGCAGLVQQSVCSDSTFALSKWTSAPTA